MDIELNTEEDVVQALRQRFQACNDQSCTLPAPALRSRSQQELHARTVAHLKEVMMIAVRLAPTSSRVAAELAAVRHQMDLHIRQNGPWCERMAVPRSIPGESFTEYLLRTNAHQMFTGTGASADAASRPASAGPGMLPPSLIGSCPPASSMETVQRLQEALKQSVQETGVIQPEEAAHVRRWDAFMQADLAARQEAEQGLADRAACTVRANVQAQQARERQLRAELESQNALQHHQQMMEQLQAARMAAPPDRWTPFATGIEAVEDVKRFFARRQPNIDGRTLRIETAVRLANDRALSSFISTGEFDINPMRAHPRKVDTLLFHGTSEATVANIQATGRPSMGFAAQGMLGRGIYGALDPRKSLQYCRNSQHGNFMFICRFNLSCAKHAGPSTPHRNSQFDEFCVYDDSHVVVLWMLKLTPSN